MTTLASVVSSRARVKFLAAAGLGLVSYRFSSLAGAQDASPAATADGEIAITIGAHDFSFDIPAEVPAGWVRMILSNQGAEDHHAQLLRLKDGMTFDQLMAAFASEGEAALGKVGLAGGPGIANPGATTVAIVPLEPGDYVAACFVAGADGVPHLMKGMITPFKVVENGAPSAPPAADVTIDMLDFAFKVPAQLPAGEAVFECRNTGAEPHEFAVLRLAEGFTLPMLLPLLAGEAPATPEAGSEHDHGASGGDQATPDAAAAAAPAQMPFAMAGGLQAIDPGLTGYALMNLQAGSHVALCFIPSAANGGQRHAMLGMIAEFTVA